MRRNREYSPPEGGNKSEKWGINAIFESMKQKKSFCLIALIVFVCSGFSNGSQSDCVLMNEASGGQKQQDTLVLAPPVSPTFVMEKKYHQLGQMFLKTIQEYEELFCQNI